MPARTLVFVGSLNRAAPYFDAPKGGSPTCVRCAVYGPEHHPTTALRGDVA